MKQPNIENPTYRTWYNRKRKQVAKQIKPYKLALWINNKILTGCL